MNFSRMSRRIRTGKNGPQRRGATAIEFAIIAPTLLLIIFTCFEFSKLALMRSLAQSAAYEACRHVIVEGAVRQEALDEAERILARLNTQGATIEVNGGADIDASTTEVTVVVDIPMDENAFLIDQLFTDKHITTEMTLKTERYTGYYDGGEE